MPSHLSPVPPEILALTESERRRVESSLDACGGEKVFCTVMNRASAPRPRGNIYNTNTYTKLYPLPRRAQYGV